MHSAPPLPNHDAAAMIIFLHILVIAALLFTLVDCWAHRNRGTVSRRRGRRSPSRQPLLRQERTGRDLERALSSLCPSPYPSNGYGTINPFADFDGTHLAVHAKSRSSTQSKHGWSSAGCDLQSGSSSFISSPNSSPASLSRPYSTGTAPTPEFTPIGDFSFSATYDHIRTLAYCSEGPVHLVRHRVSGKQYVIKQTRTCVGLPDEADILGKIEKHPNLIEISTILAGYTDDRLSTDIVTPFCELGDVHNLIDHLRSNGIAPPREFILHFVASMIDALAYIHNGDHSYNPDIDSIISIGHRQPSVIHRDVKPLNIFMTASPDPTNPLPTFKLADFGLACTTSANYGTPGTTLYQAPEIIAAERDLQSFSDASASARQNICSPSSDMYALGVSLYQLIFLKYYDMDADLDQDLLDTCLWDDAELGNLLQTCLAFHPAERLSARSLIGLSHKIKTELQAWVASGGTFEDGFWPDPMALDIKREAKGKQNVVPVSPEVAPAVAVPDMSTFSISDYATRTASHGSLTGSLDELRRVQGVVEYHLPESSGW